MAVSNLWTFNVLIVIFSFITTNYGDNDIARPHDNDMDDIRAIDHLLRGSNEDRAEENEDIVVPVRNKNIEPEKTIREIDKEEKENNNNENDYEINVQIPSHVSIDKNIEANNIYTTSTEVIQATTDAPEDIQDRYKNFDDSKDMPNDFFVSNRNTHNSDKVDDDRDDIDTSVTPLDATETVTDDFTLSMIDNNVYRSRDSVPEDIYTNGRDNTETGFKPETTTMQPTTGTMGDLAPRIAEFDEDIEVTGQRHPKTENSKPKQQIDKRNYDVKPRPLPAVSKSSTLKSWLEDTWLRPPAGILVPLRPMALNRALAVWNDLTAVEGLNLTDIVIVGYDSNGVNWRSRHNLQSTSPGTGDRAVAEALSKLLVKYQDVHTETTNDGTMRALASAAKLVPYDSALFVVTDRGAGDPQRLPLALRALVEKRLKVYTIWTDPKHPSKESELALRELRNISKHTEGEVLPYSIQVMDVGGSNNMASEVHQWDAKDAAQSRRARLNSQFGGDNFETLLVRRGGGGAISLGVPVENGVTALRIYIEGAVEHAVLYPPNDAPQIDLYNESSVLAFSPASRTEGWSPREVHLLFPGAEPYSDELAVLPASISTDAPAATVGLWHLSVRCDTCDYRLCVGARAHIHFRAQTQPKDMLKLSVTGPVASVRESLLVDEYGAILSKLPFSYQPIAGEGHNEPLENLDSELMADVQLPALKSAKVYAKIVGRDVKGEPFVRLHGPIMHQAEVRMSRSASIRFPDSINDLERAEEANSKVYNRLRYNDSNVLPNNRAMSQVVNQHGSLLTTVQIGLSSRIYGAPGDSLQLHFEVTNYREQSIAFRFGAVGELRFLTGISPASQTIPAGQTVNVIVSLVITATAQPGARDLITFTAYGQEQVSISSYVYVVNVGDTPTDTWAPELRHNFQGTCVGRTGTDCAQHVWSATVIARDAIGGLLRLSSSPPGLVYDSNFISGSREEVIATYRATCCAPRVMVTAVDAYGNANSYVIDISNYFTEAAIAAIVLGVFLAIALIGLIVFLIYWCVRRRKESRELPTYTSSSSRNIS